MFSARPWRRCRWCWSRVQSSSNQNHVSSDGRQSLTIFVPCPKLISTLLNRVCSRHRCSLIQITLLTPSPISSAMSSLQPFNPRTVHRISGSSHINRILSQEATHAKRYRRRLKRSSKKTDAEADRLAYRQQCKLTNNFIIGSRKDHFAKRIADMNAGSKQRWSAVNEFLHSRDRSSHPQSSEAKQLCNTIS